MLSARSKRPRGLFFVHFSLLLHYLKSLDPWLPVIYGRRLLLMHSPAFETVDDATLTDLLHDEYEAFFLTPPLVASPNYLKDRKVAYRYPSISPLLLLRGHLCDLTFLRPGFFGGAPPGTFVWTRPDATMAMARFVPPTQVLFFFFFLLEFRFVVQLLDVLFTAELNSFFHLACSCRSASVFRLVHRSHS